MSIRSMFTLSLVSVTLCAAAPGWNHLQGPAAAQPVVYRTFSTPKGYVIEFQNAGSVMVHFAFRFVAYQTKDQALTNGRITLSPGTHTARVRFPVVPSVAPVTLSSAKVQAFNVRFGPGDVGRFDPEAP